MEPFDRIPVPSADYESAELRNRVDSAIGKRRRATRRANLGTFTGYRIGLDIGNGNIGWCVLFEEGRRLRFLTSEAIVEHNRSLPGSATRTQLPCPDSFVPLGAHKFEARERSRKGQKSLSKIRAEARASRRLLDARQRRRLNVANALRKAGLLPDERNGEALRGHTHIKADALRARLLEPSFPAHRHDLGRALRNALKRRGYMKPIGRAGADEGSGFASRAESAYREALDRFECRTVGEFLERCARDARNDDTPFRKRHKTLAWQKQHPRRGAPGEEERSYEALQFLSPTFSLIKEECNLLRKESGIEVDDGDWAEIEDAAEFRRPLKAKVPGRCRYLPHKPRCVAALPSYQRFRVMESVANLRDRKNRPLDSPEFRRACEILEKEERIQLGELSRRLSVQLNLDRGDGDTAGSRRFVGAKTDIALGAAFGEKWRGLPIERRDDWTMRFLRRHWPPEDGGDPPPWTREDEERLESEAAAAFGSDALAGLDDDSEIARMWEDRFAAISVEAARLLGDCHARRLSSRAQGAVLKNAGAPESTRDLYERLPYYAEAMPDIAVPAAGFAPADRTVEEERLHGRAANPDVHVVMNRLRAVVNGIVEMMGGILPTTCVVEMARSTFSEAQADAHMKTAKARRDLRDRIVSEIGEARTSKMPAGPNLDRLVDRWKAAIRQGWRDYDGSEIQKSALADDGAEYQLDHVEPAAFGAFREDNMFVSRFNRQKGRRLPWKAFGGDLKFRPALLAFAAFGVEQYIENAEKRLRTGRVPARRRRRAEEALERARAERARLEECDERPRPDVLKALRETAHGAGKSFRPAAQAALFRRCHPGSRPRGGGPAARDVPNIGWSTKLARRYLGCLGAETEPVKAWDVHALRCMFGIDKRREDLRNHAVDAFLTAHFDKRILVPTFARLRADEGYEELYGTRALRDALSRIPAGGSGLVEDIGCNIEALASVLPTVHAAHRTDNRWNPGDGAGGGFGVLGKENIYSYRPDDETRKR